MRTKLKPKQQDNTMKTKLKIYAYIALLILSCVGIVGGALAYGALTSGKLLYVEISVQLEPAPLTDSQLAALALYGEIEEGE